MIDYAQFSPKFLENRQIGDFQAKSGAFWGFLAQKSPKKKYVSKCLKLPNSSRNAIKNFCPYVTRARADLRARGARKNAQKHSAQCLFLPFWQILGISHSH